MTKSLQSSKFKATRIHKDSIITQIHSLALIRKVKAIYNAPNLPILPIIIGIHNMAMRNLTISMP